jgi:hypothetical protein
MGQKQTHAPQQNVSLFNRLIGAHLSRPAQPRKVAWRASRNVNSFVLLQLMLLRKHGRSAN